MGSKPDTGKTRSALLSSMPSESGADPLCCIGWGAVAVSLLVVCCSGGWLSQAGAEVGAPDRVPPVPVHGKQGRSQFGLLAAGLYAS